MYGAADARREVREAVGEGYGFDYIRIFLNDLARSGDITRDDRREIMRELMDGKFGRVECSYGTIGGN